MRKQSRYKIYQLINTNLKKLPLKILSFHRPKWIKLKKISSIFNRKPRLLNLHVIKNSFKVWVRVKKHHKLLVNNRKILSCIFDGAVKLDKIFSKKKISKLKIVDCFLKLYFRVDILLNLLNLFSTSYQAREFINNGNLLVNKKFVRANYFLRRGDLVEFNKIYLKDASFKYIVKKFSENLRINNFLEVDYYSGSFIVIKDFDSFSKDDLSLGVTNFLSTRNLI
jgi:ribosomal protein S4